MNSASELKYPVRFDEKERKVCLSGEAYFEVTKDSNRPFYVVTEEMQIRVYGTEFNVNTHQPGKIHTVLVGGEVGIKKRGAVEEVTMKPGQLASFDREAGTFEVKEVDVRQYVVWKDGYFTFENERTASGAGQYPGIAGTFGTTGHGAGKRGCAPYGRLY